MGVNPSSQMYPAPQSAGSSSPLMYGGGFPPTSKNGPGSPSSAYASGFSPTSPYSPYGPDSSSPASTPHYGSSSSHYGAGPQQPPVHYMSRSPPSPYSPASLPAYYGAPYVPPPQFAGDYPASPPRPYPCDVCALSFDRHHDLKRHRTTHAGERPYVCNGGCEKTFTRKDALKRHQLSKECGRLEL
ncbi:hypothetical protein DFH07DRAFT_948325 [Mycena maculata]|uniref:C2H2-type domain-containing protein n=1 Tax=Mycena maculata TaxID=230809 RepID=A0AAD7P243_9AGAR|nr:hypothetical protein DFH07DRAFT_948325 [Mycena maculata]